jgi:aminoglycoside N3'-acetyltransferase
MTPMHPTHEYSIAELVEQLHSIGVQRGDILLVHTSFRMVRPVQKGPHGLIEALFGAVGPTGTVVMPSWGDDDNAPFDPRSTPSATDLGITAATFWQLPGVIRSSHCFAFAAYGPHAEYITSDPLPLPPHRYESPVGRVYERDGKVLLLGVDHDANTTIHLAELLAGVPYRIQHHCTIRDDHGRIRRIEYGENDHCCQRFIFANEWLDQKNLQRVGFIGNARSRFIRSRDIVRVVREQLQFDPLLFLHPPDEGCTECDEARRNVKW